MPYAPSVVVVIPPQANAFLVSFKGNLDLAKLAEVAADLMSNAGKKPGKKPVVPGVSLQELRISIASTNLVVGEENFLAGYMFTAKFTLFGVKMFAKLKVNIWGVHAVLRTSTIKLAPMTLCKSATCKPDEGPEFELELKMIPPSFKLATTAHVSVVGLKFGASVVIWWKGLTKFSAVFTATPLSLAGGLVKLSDVNQQNKGPSCEFDSSKSLLRVSGYMEILGFGVGGLPKVLTMHIMCVRVCMRVHTCVCVRACLCGCVHCVACAHVEIGAYISR